MNPLFNRRIPGKHRLDIKCRILGHDWHRWESGHVYDGGYFHGMSECRRCDLRVSGRYRNKWTGVRYGNVPRDEYLDGSPGGVS